jgi:hypothetical protein
MSDSSEYDDLRDHYDFDYRQMKPNRYAALFGPLKPGGRIVYLEPEVAARFPTSEDVNRALKSLLDAMPKRSSEVPNGSQK